MLAGDGRVSLYQSCSGADAAGIDAAWVHSQAESHDQAASAEMSLFVRIYGAFVGNMALLFKSEGGIYVSGGIGAKIISWMRSDAFISAYLNKGEDAGFS